MKKFVTFVLTAAMAVSALSVNAFADETEAPAETAAVAEETAEAPAEDAEAPAEDAEAPAEDAEAPAEDAEAPAEDAEAPAEDAEAPAEDAEAEEPAEVETPAEPAAPATAKAVLSNAKVAVNGTAVEFQAYNIGGNNYFKLRDVAVAVDGTVANFEVGYDSATKAITLTKGTAYTGSKEAATATAGEKTAKLSTQVVVLDGAEADLTAYNIDGYNYFKLRDLGTALGFEVTWDSAAKLIGIAADALEAPAEEPAEEPAAEEENEQEEIEKSKATEFTFELAAEEERVVENLIFDEDVTISGDFATITFENCEFNGDVINAAEQATKVVLSDGTTVNGNCVFKNTIKEATMDTPMPKFVSSNTLNIVCEDCIGLFILAGTEGNVVFNGETYSMADVEFFYDADTNELVPYEEQEASVICVGQWWENGEKTLQMFCE